MSYTKAIHIFEALPESEKKLQRYDYNRNGGKCAIGILIDVPHYFEGETIRSCIQNSTAVRDQIAWLGLTKEEASELQVFVDETTSDQPHVPNGRALFDAALQFMKDRCADH